MKIAVIYPSRGLAFSQTCEELLENLEGFTYDIFFSHKRPIPDCFNDPVKQALRGLYTHFFFVEDDMILPKNTLKTMLNELKRYKVEAVACDYPLDAKGKAAIFQDPVGNIIYGAQAAY